jgi:cytochrome b
MTSHRASPPAARSAAAERPVRVWDLPTRLFHWALAVCVIGAIVSAKIGGNAMVWHFRFGLAVLALLAFRLIWGFVGGRWSRFASFLYSPRRLWAYVRGRSSDDPWLDVGHSPTGALSVFAMLGILGLQVATGLVADDEIATTGPLNRFVSGATAADATAWHKDYGQYLIAALVALHVLAIVVYAVRGRNLVRPMLGGDKALPAGIPASSDSVATRLVALAVAAAAVGLAVWVGSLQ